jgi:hypothetical protein
MLSARFIRVLVLACAVIPPFAGVIAAEAGKPAPAAPAPRRDPAKLTLKERSGGTAMDEQRVNDCKVPFELRGDHHRPAECAKR